MKRREREGKKGREGIVSSSPAPPPPSFKILKPPLHNHTLCIVIQVPDRDNTVPPLTITGHVLPILAWCTCMRTSKANVFIFKVTRRNSVVVSHEASRGLSHMENVGIRSSSGRRSEGSGSSPKKFKVDSLLDGDGDDDNDDDDDDSTLALGEFSGFCGGSVSCCCRWWMLKTRTRPYRTRSSVCRSE